MRTLRLSLAGTVSLMLLGGLNGVASAQEDIVALEAPHRVAGEITYGTWVPGSSEFDAERGVLERYGWLYSFPVELDDPSLSGTMWSLWNNDVFSSGGISVATVALVNDVGSWVGTTHGYVEPAESGNYRHYFVELTGTGSYGGHSALLHWHGPDDGPWDVEGFSFPGELPPMPDPVQVPAE